MDDKAKKELIGALIKKEREKQGINQDKFSSLIDIDSRNLSKIERGKSFPSLATFCKIIEVLKIEPNYFLSFIQFEKTKDSQIDLELFANIKTLSDSAKTKINELIHLIK